MPAPAQLGDRATHRVADRHHRFDAEHVRDGDDVVRAVRQPEVVRTDAMPMSPVVHDQDVEALGQGR